MTELDPSALNAADPSLPSSARAYHFAAGGKDHFGADRAAAGEIMGISPDAARIAFDNRAFLARAVAHAAGRGVRQFLDIGAGLPLPNGNTHQWALGADSATRTVYVDCNPVVVAHLKAQVQWHPQVIALSGDLRDPDYILASPLLGQCVDLREPVAVILGAVLHFIESPQAFEVVEHVKRALAPGSFLVISHGTRDGATPEEVRMVEAKYAGQMQAPLALRGHEEIARFFDGFRLAEPGLVNVTEWGNPVGMKSKVILYGGVARKPALGASA